MKKIVLELSILGMLLTSQNVFAAMTISNGTASNDETTSSYQYDYTGKPTLFRVYIDTDRNKATGFVHGGIGAEFLIQNGNLYKYTGSSSAKKLVGAIESSTTVNGVVKYNVSRASIGETLPNGEETDLVYEIANSTSSQKLAKFTQFFTNATPEPTPTPGDIHAGIVPISTTGSLQNPCFSPKGDKVVFTRFRGGYNKGLSDIMIVPIEGGVPKLLSTGLNAQSVNLPGSCWNAVTNEIVFTSDAQSGDEVYVVSADGGTPRKVTNLTNTVAWEPSFSKDGQWIVFESHPSTGTDSSPGSIYKIKTDGSSLTKLTSGADDRQPNWSPRGDLILFQSLRGGGKNWDIWTMNTDGTNLKNITPPDSDDTDASFSPSGNHIVYSSDNSTLVHASLFILPVTGGTPIRANPGRKSYDGAVSWSPDGKWLIFETSASDPDGTAGTKIEITAAPVL